MAVVNRIVPVTPERVFAVLADGWSYSDWVVGTAHISNVDEHWPRPGAHIHHQAATWPLEVKQVTVAVAADPPHSLTLRPHLWPLGEYTLELTLTPVHGHETQLTMTEELVSGPMRGMRRRVDDVMLYWRGRESLRRLSDLAVSRFRRP